MARRAEEETHEKESMSTIHSAEEEQPPPILEGTISADQDAPPEYYNNVTLGVACVGAILSVTS